MRQLDAFLVWLGIIVIGLLALIFSFYVASVLLPIFLAVVVFSALFNLGAGWYQIGRASCRERVSSPV